MRTGNCTVCGRPISIGASRCHMHRYDLTPVEYRVPRPPTEKEIARKKQMQELKQAYVQKRLTRMCHVLIARKAGMTLQEVGAELGLTRERVRQIEAGALRKLNRNNEHTGPRA